MSELLDPQVILATLVYCLIGAVVFGLAFFVMVKVSPFSMRKELEEDQNVALGILFGSVVIGCAIIIGSGMGS